MVFIVLVPGTLTLFDVWEFDSASPFKLVYLVCVLLVSLSSNISTKISANVLITKSKQNLDSYKV